MVVSQTWTATEEAWGTKHRALVERRCRSWVGSPEDAREIAHDTLIVWYRRRDELDPRVPSEAWLLGIARNLCRNFLRKRRAMGELLSGEWVDTVGDCAPGVEQLIGAIRAWDRLTAAAAARYGATAIAALRMQSGGYSYEEIARAVGARDPKRIRALLQKTRRFLRSRPDSSR